MVVLKMGMEGHGQMSVCLTKHGFKLQSCTKLSLFGQRKWLDQRLNHVRVLY